MNGFLNTITGTKLKILLDSLGAPTDKEDTRPGSERRVDALDTMLSAILASGLPSDQGIRPHLSVIVGVDALKEPPGRSSGAAGRIRFHRTQDPRLPRLPVRPHPHHHHGW
ncbi:MAG: hypothetical protein ACR2FE_08790 [Aeromicrobium sp.]